MAEIDQITAGVLDPFARLNVAFNNTGAEGMTASVERGADDDWRRTMEINLIRASFGFSFNSVSVAVSVSVDIVDPPVGKAEEKDGLAIK